MPGFLPQNPDYKTWTTYYQESLIAWRPILETIRVRHLLPDAEWQRFRQGRNVVFSLGNQWVLKIGPPFWADQLHREAAALRWIGDKLPLQTPELAYADHIEGWPYLIMTHLSGTELGDLWPTLSPDQQSHLATQIGETGATLHSLNVPKQVREALHVDWTDIFKEQREVCIPNLKNAGLSSHLLDTLPSFLDRTALPLPDQPDVFLHGDLNTVNFHVQKASDHYKLTALLDFSDVKMGQPAHDFISPAIHVFKGNPSWMHAFYDGYNLAPKYRTPKFQHHLTVRLILWYAGPYLKKRLDEFAPPFRNWSQIANRYWHLIQEAQFL